MAWLDRVAGSGTANRHSTLHRGARTAKLDLFVIFTLG